MPLKRLLIFIGLLMLAIVSVKAQSVQNFDTNGPVGPVLFNQEEDGSIVYSGIIETTFKADSLFGLALECIHTQELKGTKISNLFEGITKITCSVEIPVGNKTRSIGEGWAWAVVSFDKAASFVNFNLKIDIRDNKYRYTLNNFMTDRWRIPGKGVEEGPSNLLHWQRVNSLNKQLEGERNAGEKKKLEDMIKEEEEAYQMEYKSVMNFIEDLKNLTYIEDF